MPENNPAVRIAQVESQIRDEWVAIARLALQFPPTPELSALLMHVSRLSALWENKHDALIESCYSVEVES